MIPEKTFDVVLKISMSVNVPEECLEESDKREVMLKSESLSPVVVHPG